MTAALFSFGVIADAQYADLDIGDTEGRQQRFREVPGKLRSALAELKALQPPLSFVMHLGDIINGNITEHQSHAEFNLISGIFEAGLGPDLPAYHVLGNHCLSVPRQTVLRRLGIPQSCYYSLPLPHSWRLVVLDTTEMSGHSGYPEGSKQQREAQAFLAAHPMSKADPQMSSWNGGVTRRQLAWLGDTVRQAEEAKERVIVASHHQVAPGAARATHLAWNYKDILQVLLSSPAVKLALAGHDHLGGYTNIDGKHFVTLEAMLEAPSGSNAYGVVQVLEDRVVIEGRGTVTSRDLLLDPKR
ncbi:hypothetical protein N2152v2_004746 [Parachlorella kessleri]